MDFIILQNFVLAKKMPVEFAGLTFILLTLNSKFFNLLFKDSQRIFSNLTEVGRVIMPDKEIFIGIGKAVLRFKDKKTIAGSFPLRLHYIYSMLKGRIIVKNIESGAFISFGKDDCSLLSADDNVNSLVSGLSAEIAIAASGVIRAAFKTAGYLSIPAPEYWDRFRKIHPSWKSYKLEAGLKTSIVYVDDIENKIYRHSGMKVLILENALSGF